MKQKTFKFSWILSMIMLFVMMMTVPASAGAALDKYNKLHKEASEYIYTSPSFITGSIPANCTTKTNPKKKITFKLQSTRVVTSIWMYHKNLPSSFKISKQYVKITNTKTGKVVYKGKTASGSTKNNWFIFPNKKLPAGTYAVTCSSNKTWAWGTGTNGYGLMDMHFAIPKHTHKYGSWKVVTKATTTATGEKKRTCKICGKAQTKTIPKVVVTPKKYAWVLTEESETIHKPAPQYYSLGSVKKSGAEYRYYDTITCRRTDLTYEGVVPTSVTVSNFAYPASQVSAGQRLDVKIHVSATYNDNKYYYAQGGTWSGAELLSKKLTLKELDEVDLWAYRIGTRFENYDCSTGIHRWYSLGYTNGFFGQSWTDTFYTEMPEGKSAGEKAYLLMYSDAALHWFTYTWTAVG